MTVARLTFVKLKPGTSIEEARKIWDESVIPAAKAQKGFVGGFLLVSDDETEGIALVMWDSKEDADSGEKSGYYMEQVGKFAPMFAAPPERKIYDVNSKITLAKK